MTKRSYNIKIYILLLALLAGLFLCVTASAETHSGSCGPNATWTLDDAGKLTISGTGEMTSNPWISYNNSIKSIVIENGITSIISEAFQECSNLKSVAIPNSVNSIGNSAFSTCTSLSSVTIPDSVTSLGQFTFLYCSGLNSVTINAKCSDIAFPLVFFNCPNLTTVNFPSNHSVYSSKGGVVFDKSGKALIFCPSGKSGAYSVPDGVTIIYSAAFSCCGKLTAVTLPDSIKELRVSSFFSCHSLLSITIPSGVKSIPDYCFRGCLSLKKVRLPNSLESIGNEAFSYCPLEQIYLGKNISAIGTGAFKENVTIAAPKDSYAAAWAQENHYNYKEAVPEYSVTVQYAQDQGTASASPAYGAKGTKITLKASPKKGFLFSGWTVVSGGVSIKDNQFKIGEDDVVIKAKFKKDPSYALVKDAEYKLNAKKKTAVYLNPANKAKTSITIPATIKVDGVKYQVTEIAANAFKGCSKLKKVTIGKNIVKIGKNAFKGCKKLATITIKTTKLTKKGIGSSCFKGIASKPTFKCPKKQKDNYKAWIVKTGKAPKKSKFK